MTLEFLPKKMWRRSGEAAKHSDIGTGFQHSGLGLNGASEQLEESFVGEHHRCEQKMAGHEMESLLRNNDSTSITTLFAESGPTSLHKALRARWITG